ncbi:excinuclease ATPase subunit [Psychromonas sp. CNPT3]|uniref:hypothetical protein n=1 Tax=Psychromonas sp. CNPT3 TaxID=314282 RepID=UPI00006E792D|nr:hypothetical protein [Psychromonas sp. CNPT3]AGH79970.1 excinuclease ATPase subunit [Psychromonas sp. CNPT3]
MAVLIFMGVCAFPVSAKDDVRSYLVDDILKTEQAKQILGDEISFYFGTQKHPKIVKTLSFIKTNKKTNAFNKTDLKACQWVFLSAMKQLKQMAINKGGNAVVNIKSNYKNNLTSSNSEFRCGAGVFIAGVALTGDVVKLK